LPIAQARSESRRERRDDENRVAVCKAAGSGNERVMARGRKRKPGWRARVPGEGRHLGSRALSSRHGDGGRIGLGTPGAWRSAEAIRRGITWKLGGRQGVSEVRPCASARGRKRPASKQGARPTEARKVP